MLGGKETKMTNTPNKRKPLKMPLLDIFNLQEEVKRLLQENEKIKKGLPVWRKASGLDNVDYNKWCILYSKLYGIGIGYWSPC